MPWRGAARRSACASGGRHGHGRSWRRRFSVSPPRRACRPLPWHDAFSVPWKACAFGAGSSGSVDQRRVATAPMTTPCFARGGRPARTSRRWRESWDEAPMPLRLHARRLGLHHPPARRRWTSAEDASVRDGYGDGLRCEEIAAALPGRSATAVAARARKLGLATYARRWTREEDARLPGLLEIRTLEDAARVLGRTPEAVRRRASKLALAPPAGMVTTRSGEPWTVAEDELLKLHAAVNPSVLAGLLGRSDRAVVSRLRLLGLRAGRWRSPHHPVPTNGGLTPGERALVERELQVRGSRALLSLEQRLERPLGRVSASQRRPARRS